MLFDLRAPLRLLACLATLTCLPTTATAGTLSAALAAAVADEPRETEVLVELDVDARVESTLAGPDAVAAQRADIARAGDELLAALAEVPGWSLLRRFETIGWLALRVDRDALRALEESELVRRITRNGRTHRRLERSVPQIRGTQAIADGWDGSGWSVAVIDSGVDRTHPFLAGRVVAEGCFTSTQSCPDGTNRQTGPGAAAPCAIPDECSHGTHVAGIAAGEVEEFSGVAPGATIIAANVESYASGPLCEDEDTDPCVVQSDADILAALEWVYSLRGEHRIASVNLSLGGGRYESVAECDAEHAAEKAVADNLRGAGILVVAAAGNAGFTDALEEPACISSILSVGAVTRENEVASYSASAPFLDLLAPGADYPDAIESSVPPATGELWERQSGTSMATPHVAGAIAVLRGRAPNVSADAIVEALRVSGTPILDPRNGVTTPRIDVHEAVYSAPLRGSGLQITPDGRRTLVTKTIGGERWSIVLRHSHFLEDRLAGNVFRDDGGPPSFVTCMHLADSREEDEYARTSFFMCWGAGACTGPDCPAEDAWSLVASDVGVPKAFFLPPPDRPDPTSTSSAPRLARAAAAPPARPAQTTGGMQRQVGGSPTLVTRTLGSEIWSIAWDESDDVVTGVVHRQDGGAPSFLACDVVDATGDATVALDCLGADPCTTSACPAPDAWTSLGRVDVPRSFFEPPS